MKLRLDKFLADMGFSTRRGAKDLIKSGAVQINNTEKLSPGLIIDTTLPVYIDNQPVYYEEFIYLMMNKPAGAVSSTDEPGDLTVIDLLNGAFSYRNLFPAGRLDRDTEGLLILTDDGALAHRLLSPRHHVKKVYLAKILGELSQQDVQAFLTGMDLGDFVSKPAELEILPDNFAKVTVTEGKYHQVKRMFQAVGKEVTYLKRINFGGIELDYSLKPGEFRRLNENELEILRSQ